MGGSKQRHGGSGRVVPISGTVHPGLQRPAHAGWWTPVGPATTGAILILLCLILLPDINGLYRLNPPFQSDAVDAVGWAIYDACLQIRNAAFCLLLLTLPRYYGVRIALWFSAAWYLGQGLDEAFYGNTFHQGWWEYPALAFFGGITGIVAVLNLRRHDRQDGNGSRAAAPLDAG